MTTSPTLINMAAETVASAPGIGTINLSGQSIRNRATWAMAGAEDGATYRYMILDGTSRELASGVYSASANSLTRTTEVANVGGVKQTTPINASANAIIENAVSASDIVTPAMLLASSNGGFINKIRNGCMDIAQRGTSGSTAGSYTLDGHIILASGASCPWSKVYSVNLAGNALRMACASGMTDCSLIERVESIIASSLLAYNLTAQPITFQFALYNGTANPITPQLSTYYCDVTIDSVNSGLATDLAATNLQTIQPGTSGIVAYTFVPSVHIGNGYQINIDFGAKLNASSGYIDITRMDLRATPGLATGLCSNPPPPELRPASTEFVFCQRYLPGVAGANIWGSTYLYALNATASKDSIGGGGCGTCAPSVNEFATFTPYAYVSVQFTNQARVAPTGIAQSAPNYGIAFGSASLSGFQSAGFALTTLSVSAVCSGTQSAAASLWGGASSSSWAVFTGAEL